jgi:hypothetical protein
MHTVKPRASAACWCGAPPHWGCGRGRRRSRGAGHAEETLRTAPRQCSRPVGGGAPQCRWGVAPAPQGVLEFSSSSSSTNWQPLAPCGAVGAPALAWPAAGKAAAAARGAPAASGAPGRGSDSGAGRPQAWGGVMGGVSGAAAAAKGWSSGTEEPRLLQQCLQHDRLGYGPRQACVALLLALGPPSPRPHLGRGRPKDAQEVRRGRARVRAHRHSLRDRARRAHAVRGGALRVQRVRRGGGGPVPGGAAAWQGKPAARGRLGCRGAWNMLTYMAGAKSASHSSVQYAKTNRALPHAQLAAHLPGPAIVAYVSTTGCPPGDADRAAVPRPPAPRTAATRRSITG